MNNSHSVLGKGLSSLIPNADISKNSSWGPTIQMVPDGERIVEISVLDIDVNPWQPRKSFDADKIRELADSIKEYGMIQPLIVTKHGDRYQLIAGERRLKAAKLIVLATVPCVIRKAEDQKKLEVSLIENIQRQNLNPLEEALSYRRLMDEFSLTQEEVAKRVGKSRSSVANFVRLLTLPKPVLEAIEQDRITFSHAKIILSYETEQQQLAALRQIIDSGLTVAQASKSITHDHGRSTDPVLASWEEKLTTHLGFESKIRKKTRGGVIEIGYQSDEDLKNLLDKIIGTR